MKRVGLKILFSMTAASLMLLAAGPASAQMGGGMMGGRGQMQNRPMPMGQNMHSMQSMMRQMQGMMAQMHEMMSANRGMMGNSGMSAMRGSSKGDLPAMMQSMNSMGESMQQMLARMDSVMSDRALMANPEVRSNMDAMQSRMRDMMGSMQGMLGNMQRIQKNQQGAEK